jgi:TubC N-terminal docking domain
MGRTVSNVAAALLAELRERGVELQATGDKLRYWPAEAVTPDDLVRLRAHKLELLQLLRIAESVPPLLVLDTTTMREVLGPTPAPEVVAAVRREVIAAIAIVQAGIATGALPPRQLVRGHPLADWLSLDEIARLLRLWRSYENSSNLHTRRKSEESPGSFKPPSAQLGGNLKGER